MSRSQDLDTEGEHLKLVFNLPDPLAQWPWPRRLNATYKTAKAESVAWIASYNAFSPRAQKAFEKCDFSKLQHPKLNLQCTIT